MWKRIIILLALISLSTAGAACGAANQSIALRFKPQSWIDAPLNGSALPLTSLDIISHSSDPRPIVVVELSVNGAVVRTDPNKDSSQTLVTMHQTWLPGAPGNFTLRVRAEDSFGAWGEYATTVVTIGGGGTPAPTSLPVVNLDATPATGSTTVAENETPAINATPITTAVGVSPTLPKNTVAVAPATNTPLPTITPRPPTRTPRPPTATPTLRPSATSTPTKPTLSAPGWTSNQFFWGEGSCTPTAVTINVGASDPVGIRAVQLNFWLADQSSSATTSVTTQPMVNSLFYPADYARIVNSTDIPGYHSFYQAWFRFYIVATNNAGAMTQSATFANNITLTNCIIK